MKRFLILLLLAVDVIAVCSAGSDSSSGNGGYIRRLDPAPLTDESGRQTVWFAAASAGLNTYWSDGSRGALSTRLSPQLSLSGGMWLSSVFGLRFQATGFESRADKFQWGIFTTGRPCYMTSDSVCYWKEYTKWIDVGANAMLNLTRLFGGGAGQGGFADMNMIVMEAGFGLTHHFSLSYGSANEISSHIEIGYSRYFSTEKRLSLDIRVRALLYDSSYDGVDGPNRLDANISLNFGVTYIFNRPRKKPTYVRASRSVPAGYRPTGGYPSVRVHDGYAEKESAVSAGTSPQFQTPPLPIVVSFPPGSTTIDTSGKFNLSVVGQYLSAHPEIRVTVCGLPDETPSSETRDIWLSEHRAINICHLLVNEFDVPSSSLSIDNAITTSTPDRYSDIPPGCAILLFCAD